MDTILSEFFLPVGHTDYFHCKVNNGPSTIQYYHYAGVVLKWDAVLLNGKKVQAWKDVSSGFQGRVIAFTGKVGQGYKSLFRIAGNIAKTWNG